MNRRDFIRQVAAGAASVAGPLAIVGCGKESGLLRRPAPPVFGSPRAGRQPVLEPMEPVHREPSRQPSGSAGRSSAIWRPPGRERAWRFIVLHHSATPTGSAAEFDRLHRARGWDELGYHFVIDNGYGGPNGLVEIGSRWYKQKHGAHCKVAHHPEYNDYGVGICLVGNFDNTRPTAAQVASCARLVRYVKDRYAIPTRHIYGHKQLKPTHCPGYNFPYSDIFRRIA